jgi:hypothetical protein
MVIFERNVIANCKAGKKQRECDTRWGWGIRIMVDIIERNVIEKSET